MSSADLLLAGDAAAWQVCEVNSVGTGALDDDLPRGLVARGAVPPLRRGGRSSMAHADRTRRSVVDRGSGRDLHRSDRQRPRLRRARDQPRQHRLRSDRGASVAGSLFGSRVALRQHRDARDAVAGCQRADPPAGARRRRSRGRTSRTCRPRFRCLHAAATRGISTSFASSVRTVPSRPSRTSSTRPGHRRVARASTYRLRFAHWSSLSIVRD